jgi:hypothetical protein
MRYSVEFNPILVGALLCTASCAKSEPPAPTGGTFRIQGQAQKGPFARGTTVRVGELSASLVPTGRVFDASILDDSGSFVLPEIELTSTYVRLSANGYYFDEVAGKLSAAPLELQGLADVADASSINVNVLSHLEKPRVEYLLESGLSFEDAKRRAQGEIFSVFGVEAEDVGRSETLNISGSSTGDAALLAISAVLQGTRSVAEMSELLSNLSSDLREDGVLDSQTSGSALINEAVLLDLETVRRNLVTRYESLGITANVGDFESHVGRFVAASGFEITKRIVYPERGEFGDNLLALQQTDLSPGSYSLAADLPLGTVLWIKLKTLSGGPWIVSTDPDAAGGWEASELAQQSDEWRAPATACLAASSRTCHEKTLLAGEQAFAAASAHVDIAITLPDYIPLSRAQLEIYENGASTPSQTRAFGWTPPCSSHQNCAGHCEFESGACVPGCVPESCELINQRVRARESTRMQYYCPPGGAECVQGCDRPGHCVFGQYCDTDHTCKTHTCVVNEDCPGDLECMGEGPSARCWCSDGDCPLGQICGTGDGLCRFN